ncbi:response regulator [Fundidesulfovibrio butyratiphilus]
MKKRSILVIDDSRSTREFLVETLSEAGYHVLAVRNGDEGLKSIKHWECDIVLCDMQMPVIDGPALRRKLLSHPRFSTIPFVAMSANDTVENFEAMRQLKAAAFLTKPFKSETLFILLDRILSDSDLIERTRNDLARLEKKMLLDSIMSLAHALEARDGYTRSHSDSVAKTAVKIGQAMDFDRHSLKQLLIAGRLHDIGKIGIRDAILQKPGALTDEEYEIIKTHPAVGAKILKPIPSLGDVAEVIHSHHERFDGKGYPRGLKGAAIHVNARILAIADAFEALTSDRPYRRGFSRDQALDIMRRERGSQFCPECLDAFFNAVAKSSATPPPEPEEADRVDTDVSADHQAATVNQEGGLA